MTPNTPVDPRHFQGIFLTLLSAAAFSAKAIFAKLAYEYGVDAVTLVTLRMLFAAPFFAAILYSTKRLAPSRDTKPADILRVAIMGIFGFYLSAMLDFEGLRHISASLERVILFSYPSIVVVLSVLLGRSAFTRDISTALLLTYTGLVIAFWSEQTAFGSELTIGCSFVALCSVTYAFYILGSESLIPVLGSVRYSSMALLFAAGATVFHFLCTRHIQNLNQPYQVYGYGVALALVSTVLPTLLLTEGIRRIGANRAAIVSSVGPFFTMTLASLVLGEPLSWQGVLGGILVTCGVLRLGQRRSVNVQKTVTP